MNRTNIVVGAGIILCAASLLWLQGRFAGGDHRKATKLLRTYSVAHRPESFEQFVVRAGGGEPGQWDSEITDSCRGVVRMRWMSHGRPPTVHSWDVMVSTREIFAAVDSPSGKRLLQEFQAAPKALPSLELPGDADAD